MTDVREKLACAFYTEFVHLFFFGFGVFNFL